MKAILRFIPLVLIISSCYSPPMVDDFDRESWDSAIANCTNYREEVSAKYFAGSTSKILTINQNELQKLLGNPDKHELFTRNQKFFFYYLDCEKSKTLSVRFDALGRVKEVNIERVSK